LTELPEYGQFIPKGRDHVHWKSYKMSRPVNRSSKRRNRAVTLIEAVLYISIALALIVGGLVFFQQASTAAKTSTMVRQFSATLAEARVGMKGLPLTATPFNITSFLIAAGAVPPDMVHSSSLLRNPFGGTTEFWSTSVLGYHIVSFMTREVPQEACARLLSATSGTEYTWGSAGEGGTTLVSSGYAGGSVAASFVPDFAVPPLIYRNFIMNPTQAGWMCKYGAANYTVKTTEPTSAPISGTVTVLMYFIVER